MSKQSKKNKNKQALPEVVTVQPKPPWFSRLSVRQFYLLSIILMIFITIVAYGNSLDNEFTNWDDISLVVNNTAIRSLSLDNIKAIFTPHATSTFQPIRVLSYAIDYHFWQLDPVGYHIHNIALHLLSAVLLLLILCQVIPQIDSTKTGTGNSKIGYVHFIALQTALLFALHPVNVEAVTWLSSRKYALLGFFSFFSFYMFIKSSENNKYHPLSSLVSFLSCLLALMSSPFGIMLPGLFFIFDYCRDSESNPLKVLKKRILHYIPYLLFLTAAVPFLLYVLGIGSDGGIDVDFYKKNPFFTMISMFKVLFDYARNFIFPLYLKNKYIDYMYTSPWNYKIVILLSMFCITAWGLFREFKKGRKKYLFCFFWFIIAWSPSSNIIPISTTMADRYVYIASVGPFLAFSFFCRSVALKLSSAGKKRILDFVYALLILLFISLAGLTYQRNRVWENSLTLWQDCIKGDPRNPIALTNLSQALFERGMYKKAIKYYSRLLAYYSDDARIYNELGSAFFHDGQLEKAAYNYKAALTIQPDLIESNNNLGLVLAAMNRYQDAIDHYQKALNADFHNQDLYNNLGIIYYKTGQIQKAIAAYRESLQINPDFPDARNNLGVALSAENSIDEAIQHYEKALLLKPDYVEAHNNLGKALYKKNLFAEATHHFQKAVEINPEYADAFNNMGILYIGLNQYKKAIEPLSRAVEIHSDYAEAHYNLALVLEQTGKVEDAARHFEEAFRLRPDWR